MAFKLIGVAPRALLAPLSSSIWIFEEAGCTMPHFFSEYKAESTIRGIKLLGNSRRRAKLGPYKI